MKAVVAQRAVFGERNNAHELLAATREQDLFRRFPAIEADLPADAPVGLKWEAFNRGWPSGGNYFFSRTAPDTTAKRAGMVWTQILAIPLEETPALEDLSPIFVELAKPWSVDGPLAPFGLTQIERTGVRSSALPSPRVVAIGEVLAIGAPTSMPVAICGQGGFADVINELWGRMPPTFRCELVFGFSFTPADISHRNLHVVCFPTGIAERWRTYARRVDNNSTIKPLDTATAFVLGESSEAGVQDFIRQAGLAGPTLATLSLYVRAAEYWTKRAQLDFQGWCALAKDLSTLAPDALQAANMKREITAVLAQLLETGDADAVLSLRNLGVNPLGGGAAIIGAAVKAWISGQFRSVSAEAQESILEVLRGLGRTASAEWSAWVNEGLTEALGRATAAIAANCWSLWQHEESVFRLLAPGIPDSRSAEEQWTHAAPSRMTESLGRAIAAWCKERRWWTCYARVLLAWKDWETATRDYLATDNDQSRVEPVTLLLASTDPSSAIAFAASNQGSRLRDCGADICVAHPEAFSRFDGRSEGWRDLLRRSLAKDAELLEHLGNGQAVLFALLDCVLEGIEIEEELLASFAASGFANLIDYPRCDNILGQLPGRFREAFLTATAKGWLEKYLQNPRPSPELEPLLCDGLMSESLQGRRFSPQQRGLIQGGLDLLKGLKEATEPLFLDWVDAVAASQQRLTERQVAEVAVLLKGKSWEAGAWRVKRHADELCRADLRSVWEKYYSSFGWQERLLMRLAGAPPEGRTPGTLSRVPPVISSWSATTEKKALFVTALNLEFIEVRGHLVEVRERNADGVVYAVGAFMHERQRCEVIVALAGMGNVEASLATERAIKEFTPDYAFFVGIAGGLKEELRLGDVVAAERVYAYESGKAQKEFRSRPKAPLVSFASIQRANAVAREKKWLNRIKPAPAREPSAYVRPIAAGEKVVDSHESEVYLLIKQNYGDAYAVAMEEFGFAAAAQAHPTLTFAVVRGISDAAQDKAHVEKQNSQELAARHAAAFAFEMLAGFLDAAVRPGGGADRLRPV